MLDQVSCIGDSAMSRPIHRHAQVTTVLEHAEPSRGRQLASTWFKQQPLNGDIAACCSAQIVDSIDGWPSHDYYSFASCAHSMHAC